MSANNLSEYLQQLEIKVQLLKQQIAQMRSKIMEVEKEFTFRANFLEKEVSSEESFKNLTVRGLDLSLPPVSVENFQITAADITNALNSLFKLKA